ncbi:GNAT family N-acetyltransferase [Phreatobacter oligotrophus]|uniref:RimJ/RimL family protein N-acetyltransferase n=1 Tax=Phreatobacter oligotrophus TaxID=1122261 RepID=A0A2T4YZ63_9HYPH|nr:GNAT family N-acetyltransferase [Phreatobacter oligotrophus]PTM52233.1 RimJ/RimL family protein N-acetyltransferase [Phreatobacter oligotrophus]
MARPAVPHPVLETDRLRLRQFRPEDAEALHPAFCDAATMRWWNTPPHEKRIDTDRVVQRCIDCTPAYYRFWAVADRDTDLCIGLANYHDGHIRNRRASIGYLLVPGRQGQGLAREAVAAMIEHCTTVLKLHRLEAYIHPDNAASIGLATRLGFTAEGRLRDHLRVGEEWRDNLLLARIAAA